MSNPPNSHHQQPQESSFKPRYQGIQELGRNQEGVCITYQALDGSTRQPVLLTRFVLQQSATNSASDADYRQAIKLLRELNHPGIPRFLNSFQTADGFCLVQEYKPSQALSNVERTWTLAEVNHIAASVLEILDYLQNQTPLIILTNIKPETVFVDDALNVYLMDFGLARIGTTDMPLSRTVLTHSSFVSPELLRNRSLNEASDLYSLGVTLMCLLTQTKSTRVNTLIGQDERLNVGGFAPKELSLDLIDWLENLLSPNPKQRYPNASAALSALKKINIYRLPEVQFQPKVIELKASKFGDILTEKIAVVNPIPDTLLSGIWNNAEFRSWIAVSPSKFKGNNTNCEITIDTSKLMANQTYARQIPLQANSAQKTHYLTIKVQTTAIKPQKMLLIPLAVLFTIALAGGWFGALTVNIIPQLTNWVVLTIGLAVGVIGGVGAAFSKIDLFGKTVGLMIPLSVIVGLVCSIGSDLDIIVGFFVGLVVASVAGTLVKYYIENKFSQEFAVIIVLLTALLGMSSGVELNLSSLNSLLALLMLGTGLPLAIMILNPYWQYLQLLHHYRKEELALIKP